MEALPGVGAAFMLNLPRGKHRGLGSALLSGASAHGESEELEEEGSRREPPPPPRGKELSLFKRPSSAEPHANLNGSRDRCKREVLIYVNKILGENILMFLGSR